MWIIWEEEHAKTLYTCLKQPLQFLSICFQIFFVPADQLKLSDVVMTKQDNLTCLTREKNKQWW
jgi:uncharacterized metal-binding protein